MKTVLLHDQPLSDNGNHRTGAKRFGRGRIAGLILIALLTLGLGYLHFAGGSKPVSVPSGAHAGQLTLKHCTYGNEPADCGTLVVPENRHDPHSRLIALPITRIRAHTSHPGVPIFRLQGGPGLSNMDFPDAKRFTAHHDFVLVGYRGVDGSSRLDCPEVIASIEHSRDLLSRASLASNASAYRACAKRLQDKGVDLAGYSLPERVDDLELARHRLGYGPIDLISESAGTRTAMIYAWRYPQSIHRSVMVAANPPGNYLWNTKTTDEQIHRYAAVCAQAQDCRSRTPDLAASIHSAYDEDPQPLLVPADQEGQRPHHRLLRPLQRDRRRRRPDRGSEDDRHAPLDRQGQRGRGCVAALALRRSGAPARAGLGRRRLRRPHRRRLRQTALRERRRPRLHHRQPRHRVPLVRRPTAQRLARQPGREGIQQRPQLERPDAADQRPARLRRAARERDSPAPAAPPERAPGRPAEARPRRRLLGLRARRVHPADRHATSTAAASTPPATRPTSSTSPPRPTHVEDRRDRRQRLPRLRRPRRPLRPLVRPAALPRRDVRTEDERRRAVAVPAAARLRRLVPGRADRPGRASHGSDHRRRRWPSSRSPRRLRLPSTPAGSGRRRPAASRPWPPSPAPRSAPGSATRYRTRPASER